MYEGDMFPTLETQVVTCELNHVQTLTLRVLCLLPISFFQPDLKLKHYG